MKKIITLAIAVLLVSFFVGCGNGNAEKEDAMVAESEKEESQMKYKDFDEINFGPLCGVFIYDLDDTEDSAIIYEHSNNHEYNSRLGKELLFGCFNEDAQFESAGAAEIIELGYQGDSVLGSPRYFYKVDVKDLPLFIQGVDGLCNRNSIDTSEWDSEDEIYIYITYELNRKEEKLYLTLYISNQSVEEQHKGNANEMSEETDSQNNDNTYSDGLNDIESNKADWSQELTEEVGCSVFKAKIPQDWLEQYSWDVSPSDEGIEIYDPNLNGSVVCNIHLVYGDLESILSPFLLVGEVQGEYVAGAYLVIEDCLGQYDMEVLEFVRDNIVLNEGFEFSSGY